MLEERYAREALINGYQRYRSFKPHGAYVAVEVNNKFQVGVVDGADITTETVTVTFMAKSGQRNCFL
ncbi:unnamed protein product [Allacma fusca]|uniref:Uncharacterized protein n=1 Tax=Allacma fusca TaxID=39272 RepID=A0A8J2L0A6_9HEXA|nr:unnamed protein product [Allacma fusca]